jgi:multidrug resistance protein, MATE family
MTGSRPIPGKAGGIVHDIASSFTSGFLAPSPLAHEVIAKDVAEDDELDGDTFALDSGSEDETHEPILYRRPSGIAYGTTRPVLAPHVLEEPILTRVERSISRDAERSLLRDNHIVRGVATALLLHEQTSEDLELTMRSVATQTSSHRVYWVLYFHLQMAL